MTEYAYLNGAAACIGSISCVAPPYTISQETAKETLILHYGKKLSSRNLGILKKIFDNTAINQRNFAFETPEEIFEEDPDRRIRRFAKWAVELSSRAAAGAMNEAGLSPDMISGLVVNTCTGYLCPGLSSYLIEELDLPKNIRAYDLVGNGCGGAVPNLQISESILGNDVEKKAILSVSVEICSATFQMGDDVSLILSNALFGDGAAAALLWKRTQGLRLEASGSYWAPEYRELIRYIYKNGELHNQLSTKLPHLVSGVVMPALQQALYRLDLPLEAIKYWAIHPGGEAVINTLKREMKLSEEQVFPSRAVLAAYGNMSSATVWFVIREIMKTGIEPGEYCAMLSFGAGMSAYCYILRRQ